jgi:putative DNA primase/helicase
MSASLYTETASTHIPTTPQSIADLPFWAVWKRENGTKVPYNPVTGRKAKANDAGTFSTRSKSERALAKGTYEGICVLIDESLGVTMLDFDHVIPEEHAGDETQIPPDVRRIIRMANTYTTWSPSRTGVRMFCAATTGRDFENKNHGRKVCIAEQYNAVRFATIMMNAPISNTLDRFNDNHDDLVAVLEALDFKRRAAKRPPQPKPAYVGGSHTASEIIETASRVNGAKFCRLHAGDISGYPESQTDKGFSSEADAAYVLILCGYTGDDAQVADIWRSESRLHRKKLGREDYVARTIASARAKQSWWYEWDRPTGPILITRGDTPIQHHAFGHESAGDSGPESHSEGDTCPAQLAVARRRIRELEATVATLQVRAKMSDEREAIYRNTKLGSARQTGAALASLFQSERPREPDSATPYRMPLAKLAERTGLSTDTCSKHLKQLAAYRTDDGAPVLHAETREIPFSVDESTGEITTQHREVWIGPGVEPSSFGYILGALVPDAAPKHGGKPDRNVCPDHPLAGIIRRTKTTRRVTRECAQCHTSLGVNDIEVRPPTREFIRAPKPIQHDAFRHESETEEPSSPISQDAASIDNHSVVNTLSAKMRHRNPPDTDAPPEHWTATYPGQAGRDRWTG